MFTLICTWANNWANNGDTSDLRCHHSLWSPCNSLAVYLIICQNNARICLMLLGSTWWLYQMKHFPCYWPFVHSIHRSPVNSPHKGQWCRALMFSLICAWINGWVNNHEAGDLRCHRAHYDVTVMEKLWDIHRVTPVIIEVFECEIIVNLIIFHLDYDGCEIKQDNLMSITF